MISKFNITDTLGYLTIAVMTNIKLYIFIAIEYMLVSILRRVKSITQGDTMKKSFLVVCVVLLAMFFIQGCIGVTGSGKVIKEERDVEGFTNVKLSGLGTVEIKLGDKEELTIQAEDNLMEYLKTEMSGNTLEIGLKENTYIRPQKPVKFILTVKKIDSITVSGSGKVLVPNLSQKKFEASISGSGVVTAGKLILDELIMGISGSGDVSISDGMVGKQVVNISGSGNYKARNMSSAEANIEISGSGDTVVNVVEYLKAEVSGSGSIDYYGSPIIDEKVSGSGEINKVSK